jgi:hypothetical protein
MAVIIQLRRDTAVNWQTVNPILAEGEMAYVLGSNDVRIGDGINPFTNLPNLLENDAAGIELAGTEGFISSITNVSAALQRLRDMSADGLRLVQSQETVGSHRAITSSGNLLDGTNDLHVNQYAGITHHSAISGEFVLVQMFGGYTGWDTTLIPNRPVLLGSIPGTLTQTPPTSGPIKRIGYAISSQDVHLEQFPVINI